MVGLVVFYSILLSSLTLVGINALAHMSLGLAFALFCPLVIGWGVLLAKHHRFSPPGLRKLARLNRYVSQLRREQVLVDHHVEEVHLSRRQDIANLYKVYAHLREVEEDIEAMLPQGSITELLSLREYCSNCGYPEAVQMVDYILERSVEV